MALLLPLLFALAWTSASTAVSNRGWTITGQDGAALHTHGGEPAHLSDARFQVIWHGPAAATLSVTRVEFLSGHDCEAPPTTLRSEPTFGGLFMEGMTESARTVSIQPDKPVVVDVGFTAVDAYYTWCDRFAFRVTFQAGTETLTAIAETNVTRVEPLRER